MTDCFNLLTWPDYINPVTLAQFEQEYGLSVELEILPSAVEMISRMRSSSQPPDVLVLPDYAVRELDAEGRLASLDPSRLPNLSHLAPHFRLGRSHDPQSRVSIIKDWGTTGFIYRSDIIQDSPQSWADFWQLAEKFSGRVTILDSPGEVIGAALKMRGYSYNASSPDALTAARTDLLRLRPHLLGFETNYRPLLVSGEVCLSLGWNGDAAALKAQALPVEYVIPSEGSQIWEDDWAIAANAPNPSTAYSFLNFVLRPEVAAQEARYTRYATGNRSALALLENELRHDPSTYPPQELVEKLEAGMPLDREGQNGRMTLWNEIRT
jgi:spermidine/putrescine transport system substrate-binding protein